MEISEGNSTSKSSHNTCINQKNLDAITIAAIQNEDGWGVVRSWPSFKQIRATKVMSQHFKRVIQTSRETCKDQVGLSPSLLATIPPPQTQEAKTILTKTHKAWGG